jgi:hypothetical protein
MRWLLWLIVGLVVVVAALPFIVLSAMGVMRPAEGFCVETFSERAWKGLGDAPTAQEQEQAFFLSPELADPTIRLPLGAIFGSASDGVDWRWPLCLRSRRADHQIMAGYFEPQLTKLGEPNLRHAVRDGDSVYRLLTSPSFSRVPIAFRLEVSAASGAGTLSSAWLEDDGTKPDQSKTTPAGDQAWWKAPLPRRTMQRTLTLEQTKALQAAFSDLPPYQMFNLDGTALAIESVHDGRRDVRAAFLFSPPDATGRLFCAVASQSGLPKKVLADGDVDICDD